MHQGPVVVGSTISHRIGRRCPVSPFPAKARVALTDMHGVLDRRKKRRLTRVLPAWRWPRRSKTIELCRNTLLPSRSEKSSMQSSANSRSIGDNSRGRNHPPRQRHHGSGGGGSSVVRRATDEECTNYDRGRREKATRGKSDQHARPIGSCPPPTKKARHKVPAGLRLMPGPHARETVPRYLGT